MTEYDKALLDYEARKTALAQAQIASPTTTDKMVETAQKFYEFLKGTGK